ncbi:MAG: AIR synthase-related protein, partial [Candidatus Omnitrophota bacterium]
GKTFQEMGGSQYFLVNGKKGGVVPRVEPKASFKTMKKLSSAIKKGLVTSAHDCSEGGIGVALSEMLFSGGLGAEVSLKKVPRLGSIDRDDVILFSESNSRFVLEIDPEKKKDFEKAMKGIPFAEIGEVTGGSKLLVTGLNGKIIVKTNIQALKKSWQKPFKRLMHEES